MAGLAPAIFFAHPLRGRVEYTGDMDAVSIISTLRDQQPALAAMDTGMPACAVRSRRAG
jgi:hypothetical protein